jgi:hypothetical protein
MAEERIDSVIDVTAIRSELDTTEKGIKDLVALIQSVKGTSLNLMGAKSVGEFQALNKELQTYISLTNQAAKATVDQNNATNNQAASTQKSTTAIQQENLSLQGNIELRRRLKTSLESYTASQKEDLALLKAGTITRAEYNKRISESSVKIELYKGRISAINKEISQQTRTEKQLAIERQKNARIEQAANEKQIAILQKSIAQINKQNGAYALLSKQYNEVKLAAQNFNAQLGANNPLTIAATRNALELSNRLKEIDASVGVTNRNVGNYTKGIAGYFGKAFSGLRTLANIIPGLGISGLLLALFSPVINIFRKTDEEADKLKETLKGLVKPMQDINREAVAGTQEALAKVNALSAAVLDQTLSYDKRNAALNQLKEINEGYFGDLTLETAKMGLLKDAVDEYTNAIINAAVIKGFESEIGKVSVELSNQLGLYNKTGKEVDDYTRKIEKFKEENKNILQSGSAEGGAFEEVSFQLSKLELGLSKSKAKLSLYGSGVSQLSSQMGDLKSAIQIAVNESLKFKPLDLKVKKPGSVDKDPFADIRKAQFDAARKDSQRLADFSKEIADDEKEGYRTRLQALEDYLFFKQEVILLNYAEGRAEAKGDSAKLLQIETDRTDAELRLEKDYEKQVEKIRLDNRVKIAEKASAEELAVYDKLYKNLIDKYKAYYDEKKKFQDKEKADEEKLAADKKRLQEQLISELTTLSFTFLTAGIEREKNALQEQIDLLEQKKQKDIEVANQTIANTQDRAAAIAIIEARANAQREQLQQKQRQLDIRKAQFDKAQAIARIVQETAQNVIKYFGTPLAFLAAAIGAAQLAAVVAQPIPRYKDGTDNHKGGLMIVGDGKKSEGITLPDGTVLKSPATDTLMSAPAGTKVHPDYNKMMMQATMTDVPNFKLKSQTDTATPMILSGLKQVEKAVAKIPQPVINVENLLSRKIRRGGGTTTIV